MLFFIQKLFCHFIYKWNNIKFKSFTNPTKHWKFNFSFLFFIYVHEFDKNHRIQLSIWHRFGLVRFGLVRFGLVRFGLVLWHINPCRLFNAKSSLYIYIKYIGFGLVWFYGISTLIGYLMPNPLYTYSLNIYELVWLGFMAYQPL